LGSRIVARLFERHVLLVVLGAIALSAFFQASAAVHLLGAALATDVTAVGLGIARLGHDRSTVPDGSEAARTGDAILSRNPFDSLTGPLIGEPIETRPEPVGSFDPLVAPACEGIRVAMVTESLHAEWSMVTLQLPGEPGARLLRRGDEVSGQHIAHIGHNPVRNSPAVWLTANSSVCQAVLFAPLTPPAAVAAKAPAVQPLAGPAPAGPLAAALADVVSRIKKVSDTEYDVDRAAIDTVLKNQMLLMQSVRIVPEHQHGKVTGIRLFGIRADTLLGAIGFSNGDRLESINGIDMDSPEKLLQAYARLPAASSLTVKLNRRGQPTTVEYRFK
jgi:general secretion pathway protein C